MNTHSKSDKGFTLVEILIAIVLVGVLSAVAVVGISNMVGNGQKAGCTATADSSRAASAVYFASHAAYPADFKVMTQDAVNGPALVLPSGVTLGADPFTTLVGSNWTLTLTPQAGVAPTFTGCPA